MMGNAFKDAEAAAVELLLEPGGVIVYLLLCLETQSIQAIQKIIFLGRGYGGG